MKMEYRKDLIRTAFCMLVMGRDNLDLETASDFIQQMEYELNDANSDEEEREIFRDYLWDIEDYSWYRK